MKTTTKLFTVFCILFLGLSNTFADESTLATEGNYDYYLQDFVVSAYYSPLPNQTRYLRDSYEGDIRLNGNGTNAADGTEVHMGLLAAPKSYAFGTQIDLPGLGIGEVHDRGGAIVAKKDYHRIDVWMGYGDEGLTRALNWGMREVTGKVFFQKKAQAMTLDFTVIPAFAPQVTQAKKSKNQVLAISKNLEFGIIDKQIPELKKLLKTAGYFMGEVDNNYFDEELKQAVIRYQVDKKIISSVSDSAAGYVGYQTRSSLSGIAVTSTTSVATSSNSTAVTPAKTDVQMAIQARLGKDSSGDDVKHLQILLSGLGYYTEKIDSVYSDEVIAAVFAFQKDNGVVVSESDAGAGLFGEKTKAALANALKEKEKKLAAFPVTKSDVFTGTAPAKTFVASAVIPKSVSFPSTKGLTIHASFQIGDASDQVRALQKTLAANGLLDAKNVTGYFGPLTAQAVSKMKAMLLE